MYTIHIWYNKETMSVANSVDNNVELEEFLRNLDTENITRMSVDFHN